MPARKPTLGYPSRTDAVLALKAQGLSGGEIARRIGIPPAAVGALLISARRRGSRKRFTVAVPLDTLERLKPHADRRGITANEIARRLVDTIVDEGMVDAVLDDGCDAEPAP